MVPRSAEVDERRFGGLDRLELAEEHRQLALVLEQPGMLGFPLGGGQIGQVMEDVGLFGDATVARLHAEIEALPGGGFALRNHAPAGRTRVNGQAVAAEPRPLRDGDRINLGQTTLVFWSR